MSAVIRANHLFRRSILAMREVAERVNRDRHVGAVENAIAPPAEVFRLPGGEELRQAERRHLGTGREPPTRTLEMSRWPRS